MKPLDIALCITDLHVGGAERCLVELATRLDRERFCPVVYSLTPPPETGQTALVSRLQAAEIDVYFLDARRNADILRVVRHLKQLLAAQSPQILQSFLFHANIVGRMAARRAGVPRIVSGIRVAERQSRWHLWVDQRTSRKVDYYVCVSESVAQFSKKEAGLPAEKLLVIPNGVDSTKYPAEEPADLEPLGIAADRRVVTFIGRLERQKGVAWLLETAALWLPQLPDCDLLVVGNGPEQEKIAEGNRHGISDRVHFAGWRADVPEILAASDLLVLPSRWEGMPNVVLEAMASRLPVIATRVEGVEELLGPDAAVQTVRYGDSQTFTDKIVKFLKDPTLRSQLAQENRYRAEENFALSTMVEAYQDLWESLAAP